MEDLEQIIKNWLFDEPVNIEESKNSGAAIASKCWNITSKYTLKTGNNFNGLIHHINVSRAMEEVGITSSCPLKTIRGEDFLTFSDHYYVVTEKVMDNFLATRPTAVQDKEKYLSEYLLEAKSFQKAIESENQKFMTEVMNWALLELPNVMEKLRFSISGDRYEDLKSLIIKHKICKFHLAQKEQDRYYICGTEISNTDLETIVRKINNEYIGVGFLAMLISFISWSNGNSLFKQGIQGNCKLLDYLLRNIEIE